MPRLRGEDECASAQQEECAGAHKLRKTRAQPYKSVGWDEEKEGEQWGHWHRRPWTFHKVMVKGGAPEGVSWSGTYEQMRALPPSEDALYNALANRWKGVRKDMHNRGKKGISEAAKRLYTQGGNAVTKRRMLQPSRQTSQHSPQSTGTGTVRKQHSTAVKGTAAFTQGVKRTANDLERTIMAVNPERAAAAVDKVLTRPTVQAQLDRSQLTVTPAERKLLNTIEKGMQAMHAAMSKKSSRKLAPVEHISNPMQKAAQLQAVANVLEAGKQVCAHEGLQHAGQKALGELGISHRRQCDTAKTLANAFLSDSKALALNLFHRRKGNGVSPEHVQLVTEFVTGHYLLEIPGRVTKVKRRNFDVPIGDRNAFTKVPVPTCALRDTKDNMFNEFKREYPDVVNPPDKKRGLKWTSFCRIISQHMPWVVSNHT